MNSLSYTLIFFLGTFGSAILVMFFAKRYKRKALGADTVRSMTMCVGTVATLTAVVLGLLTSTTKDSFDHTDRAIKQSAIQILTLHRLLKKFETDQAQDIGSSLKLVLLESISFDGYKKRTEEQIIQSGIFLKIESLVDEIRSLQPQDEYHRVLFAQMIRITDDLLQSRWFAVTSIGSSIPDIFLIVLWFWLVVMFGSFGLMSPLNKHTVSIFLLCALSVASAVFLILELDGAFDGFIYVSLEPLQVTNRLLQE
jgi:hypothetical protein